MTGEHRNEKDAGRGSDEPTLVICIRCTQRFPARTNCPHCSDLSITTMADSDDIESGTWTFELLEKPVPNVLTVVARAGGFRDQPDALEHAREFLRHYVAQRRARRGA